MEDVGVDGPGDAGRFRMGPLALSVFGTLGVFVALAVVGSLIGLRIAESEAREGASARAVATARVALAPFLVDGVLERDPSALAPLDAAGRQLVEEGQALHLKIWSTSGRLLWADTEASGETFDLEPDELRLFGTDDFSYSVGRLDKLENTFDGPPDARILEVYLGSHTSPSNTPVLVETYYSYSLVGERTKELRNAFLPLLIGGLAVLAAAQIPLMMALARRLDRYQQDRERLLYDVIETRSIERQRIAAQVHDGALQDLIGVSFELSGVAAGAPGRVRHQLDELGIELRRTIRSFRSILNSIYPTAPLADGWVSGLTDVVEALRARGVDVEIDVPDHVLSPEQHEVFLRTACEALRNAMSHSGCKAVVVQLRRDGDRLRLIVRDDGCGFSSDIAVSQRRDGHLGLQLISDLALGSGAVLTLESDVGTGTVVCLDVFERVKESA